MTDWIVAGFLLFAVIVIGLLCGQEARAQLRQSDERDRQFARLPTCIHCGVKWDPSVADHDCEAP